MSPGKVYYLNEGVQVRPEVFGLLFYDYRGPKLYFMASRDLINISFFAGRQTEQELIETIANGHPWSRRDIQERVLQILEMLEKKGLVHGQSLS
ncbi:MAG: mycofactocin biosynthesis chaperone MftB [Desulfobaccales bacterium]